MVNIDTQEVNIVVDKESIEEKKNDVASEQPADNIEIGIQEEQTEHTIDPLVSGMVTNNTIDASIEKPIKSEIPTMENKEKPTKSPIVDNAKKQTEKPTVDNTEKQSEIPADNTVKQAETQAEKQVESQVHTETVSSTTTKKPKPLLVEMQTQIDPPEAETSKVISPTNNIEIVKVIGQSSNTSMTKFRPTNVTEVLLDSIKKITNCNALAYKAIDDTIPILN